MKIGRTLVAFALALLSCSARAELFNFSYTFGTGDVASGSLTGTQNGSFIEGVSGVSVYFNGVALAGADLYQPYVFLAGAGYVAGTPVISFDANLNNFIFSNGLPVYPYGATNYFAMNGTDIDYSNTGSGGPLRWATVSTASGAYVSDVTINGTPYAPGYGYEPERWSITVAAPVPEPETYAMMLAGLGLLGLAARRRKHRAALAH